MSDYSFLPHLITEDIYVLKEDAELLAPTQVSTTELSEVVEPAKVAAVQADEPKAQNVAITPAPAPVQEVKSLIPKIEPVPPVMKEPEPIYLKPLPTEGTNLKHCLLLVESDEIVLEAVLKALLEKIMGAVKRSLDDVLLVNVKNASLEQIEALLSEQNHRHLIAFGSKKVTALNGATPYQLLEVGRKNYLRADALSAIAQNVDMKKALWGALKGMF